MILPFEVIVEYKKHDPRNFDTGDSFADAVLATDGTIEAAAGRQADFIGKDDDAYGLHDLGWRVRTAGEAIALRRRIIDKYNGEPEINVRVRA